MADADSEENDEIFPAQDKSQITLGSYPGEINQVKDLKDVMVNQEKALIPANDIYGYYQLKANAKEGQDFQVVDKEVWEKLSRRYGGHAIPRYSVAVPTENPTRPDYIVEVQLRKFKILTWPRVKYF